MTNLNEEIQLSELIVRPGKYAYLQTDKQILGDHFLITKDDDEVTIITEEKNVDAINFSQITKRFKLFEIRANMPFLTV